MTPLDFIYADITSQFGYDKWNWGKKIAWAKEHENQLEELQSQAKEQIHYYVAVQALRDVQAGKPTGYSIALDATASGTQLLSAMTGDYNGLKLTNVIGDEMKDPYTILYQRMLEKVGGEAKLERDDVKKAIMTGNYGSTATPKKIFGEDLLQTYYEMCMEQIPEVHKLNMFLIDYQKMALEDEFRWVMPDNFHVHTVVEDTEYTEVVLFGETFAIGKKVQQPNPWSRGLGANLTHSVESFLARELVRRTNLDKAVESRVLGLLNGVEYELPVEDQKLTRKLFKNYVKSGFLSVRVLNHVDKNTINLFTQEEITKLIHDCSEVRFPMKCIHDSYGVHPNNANEVIWIYRELMAQLSESNMLEYLLKQTIHPDIVNQMTFNVPSFGDEIREAQYILAP